MYLVITGHVARAVAEDPETHGCVRFFFALRWNQTVWYLSRDDHHVMPEARKPGYPMSLTWGRVQLKEEDHEVRYMC